jgi:hypothetical protein
VDLIVALVEPLAGGIELGDMVPHPGAERQDGFRYRVAELGQGVFNLRPVSAGCGSTGRRSATATRPWIPTTNMDVDAVAQLHSETERIGVDIHTGVEIQRIEPTVDRLRVIYKEGDSERALEADRVIGKAILSAH